MLKIKTFEFNPLAVNTYVLYDETNQCAVIDAACFYPDEKETLLNYIIDNKLIVKHLLNTHLHFDHVFGNNVITKQFKIKTKAHQKDEFLLANMHQQLQLFGLKETENSIPEIGDQLDEGDTIHFGNQLFDIFHVPGHSPGSLVFYHKAEKCAFVGDVLFNGSIGRTDLPQGNYQQLIDGIKTKLFVLPDDTKIYSGHGPATTIGNEKKHNPFFG